MTATLKFLKQFHPLLFIDARSCIPNTDSNMVWTLCRTQHTHHHTTLCGIAQSIADKVLDDAAHPLWVGIHPEPGVVNRQLDIALCGNRLKL